MLDHLIVGDGVPRRARKLLANGEPAAARVTGIRVRSRSESTDLWEYALAVASGAFRAGVRQTLTPHGERAHLGAELRVRHDGKRVVVDWSASMAGWGHAGVAPSASGWAAVDPPPDGVEDRREPFATPAGELVTCEVETVERTAGLAAALGGWDLGVLVDGKPVALTSVAVPAYAVHLLVPGTRLPAARRDARPAIDWPRAAVTASPAAPFDFDALLPPPAPADESIGDMDAWMAEFDRWKT